MSLSMYDPTGFTAAEAPKLVERPKTLDGITLGLLHNIKGNAKELLEDMTSILQKRFKIEAVIGPETNSELSRAGEAQLDGMTARARLVLTGLGD